jgi:hypothetical protein
VAFDRISAPGLRSHIGAVSGTDLPRILETKAEAAARLLAFSSWTVALVAVAACLAILVVRRGIKVRAAIRAHPPANASLHGGVVGMIAAVLFNDAGVIAAFFIGIFIVGLLLGVLSRAPATIEARARMPHLDHSDIDRSPATPSTHHDLGLELRIP